MNKSSEFCARLDLALLITSESINPPAGFLAATALINVTLFLLLIMFKHSNSARLASRGLIHLKSLGFLQIKVISFCLYQD